MEKTSSDHYVIFETRAGWVGIRGSERGISRTTLPHKSQDSAALSLGKNLNRSQYTHEDFAELIDMFQNYFQGSKVDFSVKLDYSSTSSFELAVWQTTSTIPYGETRSYAWIARQLDKPLVYRAVGTALGKNPFPIIVPCHRVLGSDGSLHGFGGGLELKQYLLDLESNRLKLY